MDEGDRLLDEGFCDDVTALASRCQVCQSCIMKMTCPDKVTRSRRDLGESHLSPCCLQLRLHPIRRKMLGLAKDFSYIT
eukprot:5037723-Amphidinium_carterae.2